MAEFALAASVIGTISFTLQLWKDTKEIRTSGSNITTTDAKRVADSLQTHCDRVKQLQNAETNLEEADRIKAIADEILVFAEDLSQRLAKCQLPPDQKGWKRYRDMIAVVWRGMRLDAEAQMKRLETLRSELQLELMLSMLRKVDQPGLLQSTEFQKLDDELKELTSAQIKLAQQQMQSSSAMETQIEVLSGDEERRHLEVMGEFRKLTPVNAVHDQEASLEAQTSRIKDALWYSAIPRRHGAIQVAHPTTFEWLFEGQQTTSQSNTTLVEWMGESTGLYWVSGRAGTGKSSLMRFLDDDPRTRPLFQHWAGSRPLCLASFYFWNSEAAGDTRLKSLSGLYRAIIFGLIDQDATLAEIMFPDHVGKGRRWNDDTFPTLPDMIAAFDKLATAKELPVAVALIIDGLDEYDAPSAEQLKLAELLCNAAESSNLKIIVSSRPETAFEQAFKHSKKIRLHQLTEKDRRIVVTDKLNAVPRLARITTEEERAELIDNVVARSEGIFLWLKLAVQTLVQEIDVALNFEKLLTVATDIPSGSEELSATFDHMLRKRIPKQHQILGLGLIETLRYGYSLASKVIPAVERLQPLEHPITTVLCSFYEDDISAALELEVRGMDDYQRTLREEMATNVIRRSCAGLLEIRALSHEDRTVQEVHYLHKDVGVYLSQEATREYISRSLKPLAMRPQMNLLKCILCTIKTATYNFPQTTASPWHRFNSPLWGSIEYCMRIAREVEVMDPEAAESLLDSLNTTMEATYSLFKSEAMGTGSDNSDEPPPWPPHWTADFRVDQHLAENFFRAINLGCHSWMSFAVQQDLSKYAILKLEKGEPIRREPDERPLLFSACGAEPIWYVLPQRRPSKVVEALLKRGADPNQVFRGQTCWQTALNNARRARMWYRELSEMATVLELLIRGGADTRFPVEWTTTERISNPQWKTRKHSRQGHEQIYLTFIQKSTDEVGGNTDVIEADPPMTAEESAMITERGKQLLVLLRSKGSLMERVRHQARRISKKLQVK